MFYEHGKKQERIVALSMKESRGEALTDQEEAEYKYLEMYFEHQYLLGKREREKECEAIRAHLARSKDVRVGTYLTLVASHCRP